MLICLDVGLIWCGFEGDGDGDATGGVYVGVW